MKIYDQITLSEQIDLTFTKDNPKAREKKKKQAEKYP